jgi:uncharacterized membrane protein
MDDLIVTGIAGILAICAAAAVLLFGIANLLVLELHALSTGDTGFILASLVALLLLIAAYVGAGLWLRRTGRI